MSICLWYESICARGNQPSTCARLVMQCIAQWPKSSAPLHETTFRCHGARRGPLLYSPDYLDIARSDDIILQAFYARVVELLKERPKVRAEDVVINLVEDESEDWSFGTASGSTRCCRGISGSRGVCGWVRTMSGVNEDAFAQDKNV